MSWRMLSLSFSGHPGLAPGSQPMGVPTGNSIPSSINDQTLRKLLSAVLSSATKKSYSLVLREFQQFLEEDVHMQGIYSPASTDQILHFITCLHLQRLSIASIQSKLSAIAYWHQIHEWNNPTDNFVVRKVLIGAANSALPISPRKGPVTPAILQAIIHSIGVLGLDPSDQILFKAISLLAFFAFLRINEYTQSKHNLKRDVITLMVNAAKISFSSFKFSKNHSAEILLPAVNSSMSSSSFEGISAIPTMACFLFLC